MIDVGVIGLSEFAVNKMIPALQLSSHFQLHCVASRSIVKSQEFAWNNKCIAHESYEDLINSSAVDLVYIPLPNAMHFLWAKQSLLAHKHVLVEKPLTLDFYNTSELVELAGKSGCLLSENFLFPYHAQSQWFRERLDGRLTGSVHKISSRFFIPKRLSSDIRYKKDLGGGALNDLGCYVVKLMSYLFGDRATLVSSNIYMSREYDVDVIGDATYLIDKSIEAKLSWGFDSTYECSFAIEGEKATLTANRFFTMPPEEKPQIFLNDKSICSLIHDNQYLNKWNSLYQMVDSKALLDSHLLSLLAQAKSLEKMRINSSFHYI